MQRQEEEDTPDLFGEDIEQPEIIGTDTDEEQSDSEVDLHGHVSNVGSDTDFQIIDSLP